MSETRASNRQSSVESGRIVQLREAGLTLRAIASEVGCSYQAVRCVLDPEGERARARRSNAKRAATKRAWENAHDRPQCPRCGSSMGVGGHRKGYELCRDCRNADKRAGRLVRAREIERLWAAGTTIPEIADALDTTPGFIGVEIHRLRDEGLVDLPYRYARNGRRAAA